MYYFCKYKKKKIVSGRTNGTLPIRDIGAPYGGPCSSRPVCCGYTSTACWYKRCAESPCYSMGSTNNKHAKTPHRSHTLILATHGLWPSFCEMICFTKKSNKNELLAWKLPINLYKTRFIEQDAAYITRLTGVHNMEQITLL